ncbi:PREDICTED: F-box protein At4g00755-like isoform X5 [Nicotiana attenuata]|uniref:F-box protein At4g00755-like isoform X5 n=1 Tax=Nicotiana attenuata TaxID=49451 RepID=UPI00090465DB|nr:PREDICTED: F-box protein At4g00755-like isoform X5 [Nicotiana attenuata]
MSSAANMIKVKNTIVQVVSQPEKSTSGVRSQIYTFMAKGLSNCMGKDWLTDAILASGTDNYPEESILNTLELSDRVRRGVSYWSSRGETDPTVPETLSYKLISNLCLVSEIHVIHFKLGFPLYSIKAVRFRVGYPNIKIDVQSDDGHESAAAQGSLLDKIAWTYTSPEFPMAQENNL